MTRDGTDVTDEGLRVVVARTDTEVADALALVQEYVGALDVDLDFQDYQEEIASFPGGYAGPGGTLLVAYDRTGPIGVVGLRRLEAGVCEMKRLYVRPAFRGRGVGRALSDRLLSAAVALGYARMRLDTLAFMDVAIGLYRSLGFIEIPPYRFNPIPGARYMELVLPTRRG